MRCFLLEGTEEERVQLRRYRSGSDGDRCPDMPGAYSYHNAVSVGAARRSRDDEWEGGGENPEDREAEATRYNLTWPTRCSCGYEFREEDEWQVNRLRLYRREDTGEETTLKEAPPGAMWDAYWMEFFAEHSPDGRVLVVKCPNGREWMIDGRASNCGKPEDKEHDCWCRHGDPPRITVDKAPEPGRSTCTAGGGSIQAGDYHGFLRDGEFTGSL